MVRHHIKKKKGGNTASKKPQSEKEQLHAELENLDRFAGSSEEESDDGVADDKRMDSNRDVDREESSDDDSSEEEEDDDEDGDGITTEIMKDETDERDADTKRVEGKKISRNEQSNERSDEDSSSNDSDDDYKEDEYAIDKDDFASKSTGMANAMTRLLGGASPLEHSSKSSNPVVLSKTTTPLQRLQQKIKTEEQALRQKRKERRSENLSAMRLPLAPTAGMSAEKLTKQRSKKKGAENDLAAHALAVAREIESERTHRRIATRGVVALFNAISKHRQEAAAEAAAKEEEKARIREEGRAGVQRKSATTTTTTTGTTKHGFLEKIKSAASASVRVVGGGEESGRVDGGKDGVEGEKKGKSVGWSALKDDFMMNSKLKDWDKEFSDDDDDDDDQEEQNAKSAPARKRVKA